MSAKLTLKGFDDYLKQLQKLNADVKGITKRVLLDSAKMYATELTKQTASSSMSAETKKEIMKSFKKPAIVTDEENFISAETGFKMGEYDSDNPSGGYIAIFNSYGTEQRITDKGENRGSLEALEFVQRAHKAQDAKIRKYQEQELTKAIKEAFT